MGGYISLFFPAHVIVFSFALEDVLLFDFWFFLAVWSGRREGTLPLGAGVLCWCWCAGACLVLFCFILDMCESKLCFFFFFGVVVFFF